MSNNNNNYNKNGKKYNSNNQVDQSNQVMYIPVQYYDEQVNLSSNYDLSLPYQAQQQQTRHPNGKKGNQGKSHQNYASMHHINSTQHYSNEESHCNQNNNNKNQKKQQKSHHHSSTSGSVQYSLASKMSLSSLTSAKGIKIYMDGLCLFDKFSCKEVSPTEELFILSSCSSQGSNSNSSVNSSVSAASSSSSDEEKSGTSSTKYFATFSIFEGPDPCVLDPPTFQFQ